MSTFKLEAQTRTDLGKGASRRLRRLAGLTPAIIYGGEAEPLSITLQHKDLTHALEDEAFYSHVLTLTVDGTDHSVVLKDLQRHPAKPIILHADFLRVDAKSEITMQVPLHFINEETCPGVKVQGGNITHAITELEVRCLPADLPEFIEVDMGELETGANVHISDLKLPKGVTSVDLSKGEDHDLQVAAVNAPKGGAKAEESEEEAGE